MSKSYKKFQGLAVSCGAPAADPDCGCGSRKGCLFRPMLKKAAGETYAEKEIVSVIPVSQRTQ